MSTVRDFRYDEKLKIQLDHKVEDDTLRTLERQCNAAKQKRSAYIQSSKRAANSDPEKANSYLEKAERIDMSYCTTLKLDKETIEEYKKRSRT